MRSRLWSMLIVSVFLFTGWMQPTMTYATPPIPPCSATPGGCNYLDPVTSGCLGYDGVSVFGPYLIAGFGSVELGWSAKCQTNWATVTRSSGTSSTATLQKLVGGTYQHLYSISSSSNPNRTIMFYAPSDTIRACGTINGLTNCTPGG